MLAASHALVCMARLIPSRHSLHNEKLVIFWYIDKRGGQPIEPLVGRKLNVIRYQKAFPNDVDPSGALALTSNP